jgi:hypothetical protein
VILYDCNGEPIHRAIGFIAGFVPLRRAQPLAGALYVVGMEVPLIEDDDDEEDRAAPRKRMRRAA